MTNQHHQSTGSSSNLFTSTPKTISSQNCYLTNSNRTTTTTTSPEYENNKNVLIMTPPSSVSTSLNLPHSVMMMNGSYCKSQNNSLSNNSSSSLSTVVHQRAPKRSLESSEIDELEQASARYNKQVCTQDYNVLTSFSLTANNNNNCSKSSTTVPTTTTTNHQVSPNSFYC
jgi:hypothetical protein